MRRGIPGPKVAAAQFAIFSRYGGKHSPRNGPWLSILHERLHNLPKHLHPAAFEKAKAACGSADTHILKSNIRAMGFRERSPSHAEQAKRLMDCKKGTDAKMIGGSISESIRSLAAGGGLVVLVAIAGCGSPEDARANRGVPNSAPAGTATVASVPVTTNAASADALARATTAVSVAGDTLCRVGETRLFSCEIGANRVSVCGGGSGAVYRYGTPGKVELSSHSLTFAKRGYSGGGESQITAKNDDYTYTVFDSTVRTSFGEGGNDPEFSSGLVIARGERVIASKMCNRASSVEALAEEVLPTGNFVEH